MDGPKLDLDDGQLLIGPSYAFHVPDDKHYPLYPSFWHWSFEMNVTTLADEICSGESLIVSAEFIPVWRVDSG